MKDFIKEFAEAKTYGISLYYNFKENYYLSFGKSYLTKLEQSEFYELVYSFE